MPQGLAATSTSSRSSAPLLYGARPCTAPSSQAVTQSRVSKGHPQYPRLNPVHSEAAEQRVHLPGAYFALRQTNRRLLRSATSLGRGRHAGPSWASRACHQFPALAGAIAEQVPPSASQPRGQPGPAAARCPAVQHHRPRTPPAPRRLSRPPQDTEWPLEPPSFGQ